jgi:pyrroline-5-carboxylate reductase
MRIGFAGAGNMAAAMARGWAGAEHRPDAMLFCDLDADRAAALAEEVGGETQPSLARLGDDSDAVVVAVKPGALEDVAAGLSGNAKAIVSVIAATPTATLAEAFPGIPVLRVMPNQPVEVRKGTLCYVRPEGMPEDLAERLLALLGELGGLVELEERLIEAAMAIMSSSPAYVAMLADALAAAGESEGLDAELSRELVANTLAGTAELLRARDAEHIRNAVASPGGATEAGLEALERRAIREAVHEAVNASLERFR